MQGDLKLYDTPDGGEIRVINGEPTLDTGLETTVYISLFGQFSEWWGNEFQEIPLTSNLMTFLINNPVTAQNLRRAEDRTELDLEWLKDTGIADEIEANVTYNDGQLNVNVLITKESATLLEDKYALLWSPNT